MKTSPKDFLLNTDYEMDKIVLFKDGEMTTSATIAHGLDYTPLPFGVWSTDKNFSSCNPLGWSDSSSEHGYSPVLSVECYALSDSIRLNVVGNTNNVKIYYRVYAFEPQGSRKPAPHTAKKASQFIVNTDYNYCKLLKASAFVSENEEFEHKLGYIPQVIAWVQFNSSFNNRIQPLEVSSEYTNFGLLVTENKIKCKQLFYGTVEKIYWRVYYDEA